jgi:DNA mismatch repair protein MutL
MLPILGAARYYGGVDFPCPFCFEPPLCSPFAPRPYLGYNTSTVTSHKRKVRSMPIHILSPDVVAKIAAGEVVERPASVVKELLENSLDAGARSIRIEVRGGGRQELRVVDDGSGIPSAEIALACQRHATSKLASAEDLYRIRTLGFRGEALASVAAVSHFTLVSRPAGQEVGMEVRVDGGQPAGISPRACTIGTIVTVRDLFYNTPARLKFLRQPRTEASFIHVLVTDYALAHPAVAFYLSSDGRTLLRTSGSGQLYDALIEVHGIETARQMLPVSGELGEGETRVRVSGYASQPSLSRASRRAITLFVNGRRIRDTSLTHAVEEAYHTLLMAERHPMAIIGVELDPTLVDVNVHPTKNEVKFAQGDLVYAAVQRAVRATLQEHTTIPHIAAVRAGMPAIIPERPDQRPAGPRQARLPRLGGPLFEGEEQEVAAPSPGAAGLPPLRVIGQMAGTYILTEGPEGLYLIDQHAAHERILYEQLLAERERVAVRTQALLEPLVVELTPQQEDLLSGRLEELQQWGFELEPFGERAYRVRTVPAILTRGDVRSRVAALVEEWCDGLRRGISWDEQLLTTIACHSAVRAGQVLSGEEMRELIHLLEGTRLPRTCPHGRPTMIMLSRAQLEREFGRRG